ncbi:MAG TPA: TolC family protein [Candidatus Gastranaerophilaceae bacterium]|nr:TolC family protein [Candidatus Gastranaerophilaceae bacterium]HPT41610.1 TolC family protein [Candidatus Gastranaerophilaceae bacterium]
MQKIKKIFALFLISIFFIQIPCFAFWGKKFCPCPINTKEKIEYINPCWWENFNDPILTEYIIKAVENNHNARQASWKVEEYRQAVKYQFGSELPSLSVGGNYILNHLPDSFVSTKNNIFAVPFQVNYEADIFLKNRDKTKSSKKTYESSKYEEKAIYIVLASDVATAYFNLVKSDKQICLQEQIVEIRREKLRREQQKFDRGTVSATSLNNAKKEVENAKNSLDDFLKTREKTLTQLAVLIGESPENTNFKRVSFDNLEYKCPVPDSISSDVVFSRPDIMATEAKLQKAKIDIRVARKEFLPKINLTGIYAFSNVGSLGFGTWGSTIAALVAGASLDLFTGGRKIANLKMSKSRYEQMFEAYRQNDLTALKEVNDSLFVLKKDSEIDKNTLKNLNIQQDTYKRSLERFNRGTISYPQLLSEHEALILSQQNRVNSKTNRLVDYLTLYKAVGGNL